MASLDITAFVPARFRQQVEPFLNGGRRTVTLLAGAALVLAVVVVAVLWLQTDSYAVLYAGLSPEEGGRAIADLQKQNIPYRVAEGGRVILVPSDDLGRARLQLATEGVPRQDSDQWGLLDNESLGVSPFVEQVHYVRAVESSLSGTIRLVDGVLAARVVLALPKQTDFLADSPKPSASVMVRLRPGVQLGVTQVAGIAGLVAAGVPGLARGDVTIVDQTGKVLTASDSDPLSRVPDQLAVGHEIESHYEASIGALLMPLLGPGNFRVTVAADVDFTRTEESSVKYGSSHVLSEDDSVHPPRDGLSAAIGIPGALSNQPPNTPTIVAPTNATTPPNPTASPANAVAPPNSAAPPANAVAPPNGPTASADQPAAASAKPATTPISDTHRTTNYDLDHTVAHLQHPSWTLRGISVAVLLNHSHDAATAPDRIQSIKTLVASAIGDGSNGSTRHIEVVDLPFSGPAASGGEPALGASAPWLTSVAQNTLIALAGLLLLFGGLAPVLRRIAAGQAALAQAFGGADLAFANFGGRLPRLRNIGTPRTLAAPDAASDAAVAAPTSLTIDPETVRTLVLNQPGRTAQVLKGWIARDASSRLSQTA